MSKEKEDFIKANIQRINAAHAKDFIKDEYLANRSPFENKTVADEYLKTKLLKDIERSGFRLNQKLWKEFAVVNFNQIRIPEIANKYFYNKKDVEQLLKREIKQKILDKYQRESFGTLIKSVMDLLNTKENEEMGFKCIRTEIKNTFLGSFYMALQGGFPVNLQEINMGIMTSNAGDSAQFLFIARAILAGFNCSNVDVRSSRYDAIIDYKNQLLRIQIKGISDGSKVNFYDRARGGQGIDYTHERNQQKRITSKDCDFYAAVDKRIGICYIIPMTFADQLTEEQAKNVKINDILRFKENWKIFEEFSSTNMTSPGKYIKKKVAKEKNRRSQRITRKRR